MLLIGSVAATRQSPLVITIEGTIGAGKSTVMQALQKIYATDESVSFVEEPVETAAAAQVDDDDEAEFEF